MEMSLVESFNTSPKFVVVSQTVIFPDRIFLMNILVAIYRKTGGYYTVKVRLFSELILTKTPTYWSVIVDYNKFILYKL